MERVNNGLLARLITDLDGVYGGSAYRPYRGGASTWPQNGNGTGSTPSYSGTSQPSQSNTPQPKDTSMSSQSTGLFGGYADVSKDIYDRLDKAEDTENVANKVRDFLDNPATKMGSSLLGLSGLTSLASLGASLFADNREEAAAKRAKAEKELADRRAKETANEVAREKQRALSSFGMGSGGGGNDRRDSSTSGTGIGGFSGADLGKGRESWGGTRLGSAARAEFGSRDKDNGRDRGSIGEAEGSSDARGDHGGGGWI